MMKNSRLLSLFSLVFVGIFLHVNDLVAKLKTPKALRKSNRAFEKAFDNKNYKQDQRIQDAKHAAKEALRLLEEDTYRNDEFGKPALVQKAVQKSVQETVDRFATYQTQADFVTKTAVWQTLIAHSAALPGFEQKIAALQAPGAIVPEADVNAKVAAWEKASVNADLAALNDKMTALEALVYKK